MARRRNAARTSYCASPLCLHYTHRGRRPPPLSPSPVFSLQPLSLATFLSTQEPTGFSSLFRRAPSTTPPHKKTATTRRFGRFLFSSSSWPAASQTPPLFPFSWSPPPSHTPPTPIRRSALSRSPFPFFSVEAHTHTCGRKHPPPHHHPSLRLLSSRSSLPPTEGRAASLPSFSPRHHAPTPHPCACCRVAQNRQHADTHTPSLFRTSPSL